MSRENSLNQINAAIAKLVNAKASNELINTQSEALAFTQAAFDKKEISKTEKQALEKKIRRIYRNQLIEEPT